MEENIAQINQVQNPENINSNGNSQQKRSNKNDNFLKIVIIILMGLIIFLATYIFQIKKQLSKTTSSSTQEIEQDIVTQKTISPVTTINTQESTISVFMENSSLYFSNSENNKTKIADSVEYYSLSSDKTKIAYILNWEKSESNPYFYIYQISDKSIEKIKTELAITASAIDWSPNDKFLVLNSGTDIVRNAAFFDYSNKSKLFEIQLYTAENNKTVEWINDTEFLFNEPQKVKPEIPAGAGYSTNISKMSVTTKQKEILKQGTSLIMYRLIKNNNGTIYFKESSVTDSDGWLKNKINTNYWQIDTNGNNLKQIEESTTL